MNPKKRIFIAFDEMDCKKFLSLATKEDLILAMNHSDDHTNSKIIDPHDYNSNYIDDIERTKSFFDHIDKKLKKDLKGYCNNFYECTVKIVSNYISCLETNMGGFSQVIFSRRLLFPGKPNYFLGEGESQGKFLYNRAWSIQDSIQNYAISKGLDVKYLSTSYQIDFLRNPLRLISVFLYRLFNNLRETLIPNSKFDTSFKESCLILIRSTTQFLAIKNLVEDKDLNFTILVNESFFEKNLYKRIKNNLKDYKNVNVARYLKLNIFEIFRIYLSAIVKIIQTQFKKFTILGLNIDPKIALTEVLIMEADCQIYQRRLTKTLKNLKPLSKILITCEQKSPHAYIDCQISKNMGLKPVQLMSSDQSNSALPYPVFGELFIVDTLQRFKNYVFKWKSQSQYIRYLGPIKGNSIPETSVSKKFDVCYFSHFEEHEQNKNIINILESIAKDVADFTYCIKTHPRDPKNWLSSIPFTYGKLLENDTNDINIIFNKFDLAVSNKSAVINELLCSRKKFVLIDTMKKYKDISVACDEEYIGYTKSLNRLRELVLNSHLLSDELEDLFNRIYGKNSSNLSMKKIINELKEIA